MHVKTAVIPIAGRGTRFLPITKTVPKEMIPILARPMIDYIIDEVHRSQIERVVFITASGKQQIEDYYDQDNELLLFLEKKNKQKEKLLIEELSKKVEIISIRQKYPDGLGHAILCAKHIIESGPFSVLLGDDLIDSSSPVTKQMMDHFDHHTMKALIGVMPVEKEDTNKYGIIIPEKTNHEKILKMSGMVEKPDPAHAPSLWATPGRYIFTNDIFDCLQEIPRGAGGEYQLTDAINLLCQYDKDNCYAFIFDGNRFDTGNIAGHLNATLYFASKDEAYRKVVETAYQKFFKN